MHPRTHVQRFFLAPNDFCVGVLVGVLLDLLVREGVELFNARDGNVSDLVLLASLEKSVVDLARAENVSGDLFGRFEVLGMRFGEVELEAGIASHFFQSGASERVTKHGLGEGQDQLFNLVVSNLVSFSIIIIFSTYGFTEFTVDLATQHVEQLSGSGGIDDLHVAVLVLTCQLLRGGEDVWVVVAELQVPFDS